MQLTLSDRGLDELAAAGYDPVFGARPLKRAIQQRLENPLAQALLRGDFGAGDTIDGDFSKGAFAFSKAADTRH